MWVLQDGGRWSHLGTEGSLAGYRERKKMWSGALWARRMGKAREPDSIPSPLKSWLQAFRGACHSAVLFLVMIYSNAAVSENIQAAGLFSKNPVCWRTWSAASTYRLELYWMLILRQADQTLAHFTRMTLRDNRTYPWSHRAKSCWRTKEGNTTTLEEGKHFAHCLSETYGFQWPNCPPTHTLTSILWPSFLRTCPVVDTAERKQLDEIELSHVEAKTLGFSPHLCHAPERGSNPISSVPWCPHLLKQRNISAVFLLLIVPSYGKERKKALISSYKCRIRRELHPQDLIINQRPHLLIL